MTEYVSINLQKPEINTIEGSILQRVVTPFISHVSIPKTVNTEKNGESKSNQLEEEMQATAYIHTMAQILGRTT